MWKMKKKSVRLSQRSDVVESTRAYISSIISSEYLVNLIAHQRVKQKQLI